MSFDTLQISYHIEHHNGGSDALLAPELRVNGDLFTSDVTLDIAALVDSTRGSGEFYIFTCGCGEPGCAGIWHGVIVLHSPYCVQWLIPEPFREPYVDMDAPEPPPTDLRTFRERTFSPAAYREAVFSGLSQAQALAASTMPQPEIGPYGFTIDRLNALKVA